MEEDKITAMWEEDGDLMKIRNFFDYLHQEETLKDRIKQKTLDRISSADITPAEDIHDSEQTENNNHQNKNKLLSFFQKKKRIFKSLAAAAVIILAVYVGTTLDTNMGLVSSDKDAEQSPEQGLGGYSMATAPSLPEDSALTKSNEAARNGEVSSGDPAPASDTSFQGDNSTAPDMINQNQVNVQKLIYILDITIKANDVSAAMEAVQKKVMETGGYVAESGYNNDQNQDSAWLTLKVPANQFQSFKYGLSQYGTIANQHLYSDDVSKEYFDVETRLRSWEAQEKRYLEILQQAKNVDEILRIEDSLSNVRREMESLKGQLKFWDNQVQYSEIRMSIIPAQSTLAVNDPWQPVSINKTIIAAKNALIKTVSLIWNAINYVVVFIGYVLPVIILGGLVLGIWILYRRSKRLKEKQ